MPDDKAYPPGLGPGNGQGKLRPTVVSPPRGKSRTSNAQSDVEALGATPVGSTPAGARKENIDVASKRHRLERRTPVVAKPTAIPGVERKRIAVDRADLRKLSPQASPAVLERAIRLVETFTVGRAGVRQTVLWGHRLQQDYSDLVSRILELSQAEVLKRVNGYINRMVDILAAVDLEAVSGVATPAGLLGQYFKTANRKIDTPEELNRARDELDQLVRLMGAALEQLLALKENLEQHAREVGKVGDEVEASAIAAEFLSTYLRKGQPALSQRFIERSMSLTQTVAQIRGSASVGEMQIEQPLRLIGAIQNVALVMVPGWLGSIAALTAMLEGRRKPTPTETGELSSQLRNILQQLKDRS